MRAASMPVRILMDSFRYSTWAKARVFAACAAVGSARLDEAAHRTHGIIAGTLKHLVGVEDVYLALLQGLPLGQSGAQERDSAHDLAWFAERSA